MARVQNIEQDWDVSEAWTSVLDIINSPEVHDAIEARRRFDERYLVNGQLLVTPKQHNELMRLSLHRDQIGPAPSPFVHTPKWSDIPVVVVAENMPPLDLGGGKRAVCLGGRIYVFTEHNPDERMEMIDLHLAKIRLTQKYSTQPEGDLL